MPPGDAILDSSRTRQIPSNESETRSKSGTPRLYTLSTWTWVVVIASFTSLLAVHSAYLATQPVYPPGSLAPDARGQGAGSCRMSFMSPSYLRLSGFGREYSRLGDGPWGLYLYREVGWDDDPLAAGSAQQPNADPAHPPTLKLTGTPVVFVPGNAGSFRQVRSLASAASRAWFEVPGVRRKGVGSKDGGRNLDFFTLDYNDDFSAFHGQTLLDQSEYLADSIRYILSLYPSTAERPDPSSVIVVAHSMGGVVARAAIQHRNYQSFSISTLITIATPHIVPPVTVDRGVDTVYNSINKFWRQGYDLEPSLGPDVSPSITYKRSRARAELADMVLISISGGISDVTIASESASLASILPLNDSHGFTVYTTAIPGVQTPIDHLAILWCQQLMQVVATSLLSIVDVRNPQGVLPRQERVVKLSEILLGAVDGQSRKIEGRRVSLETLERGLPGNWLEVGERLIVRERHGRREDSERNVQLLPVPPRTTLGSMSVFSLLTSASIGRGKESAVEVYACTLSGIREHGLARDELGSGSCVGLFPHHVTSVPFSPHGPVSPPLPAPMEDGTMSLVSVDTTLLGDTHAIAVVIKSGHTWVLAEFGDKEKRVQVVDKSATELMLGGFKIESFPTAPGLVSEIWLPALDTSLLTFKLRVYRSQCQDSDATLFAPFVRQYSPLLHETKYFTNVREATLYTHSSGPYVPPPASPFAGSGSRLQFVMDPTCSRSGATNAPADIAIEIKLDLWATLGNLVMRYRMAAVSFPTAIVLIILAVQLKTFNAGGAFLPFGAALAIFARRLLLPLLGALTVVSLLQSILLASHLSTVQALASTSSGTTAFASLPPTWLATLLLGNRGPLFAGTAAFVTFAMLSVVLVEYFALQSLILGAATVVRIVHNRGPASWKTMMPLTEPRETLPTQRVVTMAALLLVVLFFAPYQFAFLVIFLVHLFSTVRVFMLAQESTPGTPAANRRLWDRYHYSFTVLLVMLGLLPSNAFILVVWVRNLAVGWLAPFSTDHNILNVLGFLLNVEALHSGNMLNRTSASIPALVSIGLPTLAASFSLLYGIRYAHNVYPLINAINLWLAAHSSSPLFGAVHDHVIGKRRLSILQSQVPPDDVSATRSLAPTTILSPSKNGLDGAALQLGRTGSPGPTRRAL